MGTVIVLRAARGVAGAAVGRRPLGNPVRRDHKTIRASHVPHNERFEALLAGVGTHKEPLIKQPSSNGIPL